MALAYEHLSEKWEHYVIGSALGPNNPEIVPNCVPEAFGERWRSECAPTNLTIDDDTSVILHLASVDHERFHNL
jgi:hypothetical protein